jgi:predicted permease
LIVIEESHPETSSHWGFVSPQNFRDWRDRNESFEAMAAYQWTSITLTENGPPDNITTMRVSDGFFRTLGVAPVLGRGFLNAEDQPGGPKVAVLSHAFWKGRFGGDPEIIGKSLILDRESHVVVGVAPEALRLPGTPEIWAPLALAHDDWPRDFRWLGVYGRLDRGVSLPEARADIDRIASQLEQEHPETNTGWDAALEPLEGRLARIAGPALFVLMAAVAMVLAIAITNVSALLLSSGAARHTEVTIRQTLGASRARILRQFLTESLTLAVLGGGLGLVTTLWVTEALGKFFASHFPQSAEAEVNLNVFLFTLLVSVVTGLAAGIIPALQVSRSSTAEHLKEKGRSLASGARSVRIRHALVATEVALALVLLLGASLLLRSFLSLTDVNPGFTAENALTVEIELPETDYGNEQKIKTFWQALLQKVETLPGVVSAGTIQPMPLAGIGLPMQVEIEGRPTQGSDIRPETLTRIADSGYFQAMRIPLILGRLMREADAQPTLVVNQTFASRLFSGEDPIGRRVALGGEPEKQWHAIIGVVGDVRHKRLETEAGPEAYYSTWQAPFRFANLVVRAETHVASTIDRIRESVGSIDPNLPVSNAQTVEAIVDGSLGRRRFTMTLAGIFASFALLLAGVGIFGVVSHVVSQRSREVGIRMALGATRKEVLKMTVRQAMVPVYVGVAIGLLGSLGVSRFLESQVYGVSTKDPLTFSVVILTILLVASAAIVVPTRRATRVDPMSVLRYD